MDKQKIIDYIELQIKYWSEVLEKDTRDLGHGYNTGCDKGRIKAYEDILEELEKGTFDK